MPNLTEHLQNLKRCAHKNLNKRRYKPIFRQILPPILKDSVKGRKENFGDGCMALFQEVMACMKKHSFETKPCQREIGAYQRCYQKMEADIGKRKEMDKQGLIIEGDRKMSRQAVNKLLKNNPQLRPKDQYWARE